jgi:hypothetical protein
VVPPVFVSWRRCVQTFLRYCTTTTRAAVSSNFSFQYSISYKLKSLQSSFGYLQKRRRDTDLGSDQESANGSEAKLNETK